MSPYRYNGRISNYYVHLTGFLYCADAVSAKFGVRPVINLKGDIKLSGVGISNNPYTIES